MKNLQILQIGKLSVLFFVVALLATGCGENSSNNKEYSKIIDELDSLTNVWRYQSLDSAFFYSDSTLKVAESALKTDNASKTSENRFLDTLNLGRAYLNHANLYYLCSRFDSSQRYLRKFDHLSKKLEKSIGNNKSLKNEFAYLQMLQNIQQIEIYLRQYNFIDICDLLDSEPLVALHKRKKGWVATYREENKKKYDGFFGTKKWYWAKMAYNIKYATYNFYFDLVDDRQRHLEDCFDALFQLSRVSDSAIIDSVKNFDEPTIFYYYYSLANTYNELATIISADKSDPFYTKQTIDSIWSKVEERVSKKIKRERLGKTDTIPDFYFTEDQNILRSYYNNDIGNEELVKHFYYKACEIYLAQHDSLENRKEKNDYWLANFKQDIAIIKMYINDGRIDSIYGDYLLKSFPVLDTNEEQYLLDSDTLFSTWGGDYIDFFQSGTNKYFLAGYYYFMEDTVTAQNYLNFAQNYLDSATAHNAYSFQLQEMILKIGSDKHPEKYSDSYAVLKNCKDMFKNNRESISQQRIQKDIQNNKEEADVKWKRTKFILLIALPPLIILLIAFLIIKMNKNKLKKKALLKEIHLKEEITKKEIRLEEETLKQEAIEKATDCYKSFVENRKKPDFIENFHKFICRNIFGCKTEQEADKFAVAICYTKQDYNGEDLLEGVYYSEKGKTSNENLNRKGRYHPTGKKPAMFVYKVANGKISDPNKHLPDCNPLILENLDEYTKMGDNFPSDFESVRFSKDAPDEIQSSIFYPIMYEDNVLGIFTVQKTETYNFKNEKLALDIFIQLIAVYLFEEQKSLIALSDTLQTIRQNVNCQKLINKSLPDKISIKEINENDENFTIIDLFNAVYFLLFGTTSEANEEDKFSLTLWLKERKDENKRKWLLEKSQYSQEKIDDAEYVLTEYAIERFGEEKNIQTTIFPLSFKLEDDFTRPALFCYKKNIKNLQQNKHNEVFERRNWKGGKSNLNELINIIDKIKIKNEIAEINAQNIKTIIKEIYAYKKGVGKDIYEACIADRKNYKEIIKKEFGIEIDSDKDTDLNNIKFLLQAQNEGLQTNSLLYYPIISNKEVIGVLSFQHEDQYYFEKTHIEYLKIIADAIGNEIYKDNEKEIEKLTFFTALAAIVNHRSKSHFVTLGGSISRFNYKLSSDSQIKELKDYELYDALASNMFKSHTYLERSFRIFEYVTPKMAKKDFTEFTIDETVKSVKEEIEFKMESKEKLKVFWTNTIIHPIIPQDLKIISNETIFKEIFYNLIFNTIEHGFDKNNTNQKIDVYINVSETNDQYFISYENNGNPINEEERNTVFNLGHSKKTGKSNRLSGVGLFACKYLINDILNGQIDINRKSKNVKFEIIIPKK